MKIEIPKDKYNNLTGKERQALYHMKNDKNIVNKGADKESVVVVWDREDYIKEAEKQLGDNDVYEDVADDPELHRTIEKNRKRANIPHEEYLSALRKWLDNRKEKYISSDTLCDLAKVVLKNNIFKFGKKTLNKKRVTAIGTKFAPPYSILFMADLEGKREFFEKQNLNHIYSAGIMMLYFSFGSMGKKI